MTVTTIIKSTSILFLICLALFSNCANSMALSCYASSKNKDPILNVLRPKINSLRETFGRSSIAVLEIASGTGEHAAYFASNIPDLVYQPTEPMSEMHDSIAHWFKDSSSTTTGTTASSTVLPAIALDVLKHENDCLSLPESFRAGSADLLICINMIHISPFECTSALFHMGNSCLRKGGLLMTYGPYRVGGTMVDSNVQFDLSLKERNPQWGIRDKEEVESIASNCGFVLDETCDMPSNNLTLFFKKL